MKEQKGCSSNLLMTPNWEGLQDKSRIQDDIKEQRTGPKITTGEKTKFYIYDGKIKIHKYMMGYTVLDSNTYGKCLGLGMSPKEAANMV